MLQYVLTLMFSLSVHGSVVLAAIFLSYNPPVVQETVYRVSLAEFAIPNPVAVAEVTPEPEIPKPPPEPEPEPPKPKIEPKKIEPKAISAKKRKIPKKAVAKEPQPAPPPPAAPVQVAPSAPMPANYGGLRAYKEDVVDQRPSISRRVSPKYPTRARRMNIQGQVVVRLIVDTSGTAQQCVVHSANPKDVFNEAALMAARKTRFIPGKVKGQKVNTVVLIPYQFTLR